MRREVGLQGVERVLAGLQGARVESKAAAWLNAQAWCMQTTRRSQASACSRQSQRQSFCRYQDVRSRSRSASLCEGNSAAGRGALQILERNMTSTIQSGSL